jgi:hypothetical protein
MTQPYLIQYLENQKIIGVNEVTERSHAEDMAKQWLKDATDKTAIVKIWWQGKDPHIVATINKNEL